MRMQEFYESPIGNFRGRHFTRDEFQKAYAEHCGEFNYYDEWGGFNVPGHVVDEFLRIFTDIDFMEENTVKLIEQHRSNVYYVIGTFASDSTATVDHELSHAMWYLSPPYKQDAEIILGKMSSRLYKRCCQTLMDKGYSENVFDDELVAYFSTSPMWELVDIFETHVLPWRLSLELQQNFRSHLLKMKNEQK